MTPLGPARPVTRDPAATNRDLKEQSGKDIWLSGSMTLMHADWQDLQLVEATPFRIPTHLFLLSGP